MQKLTPYNDEESKNDRIARFRIIRQIINRATSEFLSEALYTGRKVKNVEHQKVKMFLEKFLLR